MEEIIVILLGLVFGSLMNVVIYRMPLEKSIIKPRSNCPSCGKMVKSYDNIPVVSYILLGGKCRHCKAKISIRYPFIELFTAFSFWLCWFHFGPVPVHAGFAMLFLWLLIALAFTDYDHQILPDQLTLGGGGVFIAYAFFRPMLVSPETFPQTYVSTPDALIASIGSALVMAGLFYFYLKVRKIEGLGGGDIKMMLMLGAFLGLQNVVVAMLIASFSGLFVGLFFIIFKGKNMKQKLPFGTFLSIGSYISLFWGHIVMVSIQSVTLRMMLSIRSLFEQ